MLQVNCQPGQNITIKVDDYRPGKESSYLRLEAKDVAGIGTLRSIALQTSGVSSPLFDSICVQCPCKHISLTGWLTAFPKLLRHRRLPSNQLCTHHSA